MYGLKLPPRTWFDHLRQSLTSLEFSSSRAENSLFLHFCPTSCVLILVYFNYIIFTGDNSTEIDYLVHQLNREFALKDLGELHYFLTIQVIHTDSDLILSQEQYVTDILARANMSQARGVTTPMTTGPPLSVSRGDPIKDMTKTIAAW